MKKIWKVLAISALVAGCVPYKVNKDENGKVTSAKALFWEFSRNTAGEDAAPEEGVSYCRVSPEVYTTPADET